MIDAGPEPTLLDWYGYCGMIKLGGSGGMLPQEIFKIRHSEIASEARVRPYQFDLLIHEYGDSIFSKNDL